MSNHYRSANRNSRRGSTLANDWREVEMKMIGGTVEMKGDRRAALAEQVRSLSEDCDCAFLKRHGDQPRGSRFGGACRVVESRGMMHWAGAKLV